MPTPLLTPFEQINKNEQQITTTTKKKLTIPRAKTEIKVKGKRGRKVKFPSEKKKKRGVITINCIIILCQKYATQCYYFLYW